MQVRAENVRKTYGDVTALDGLSLEIPAESTFGVLGTNGAGKSTLFRLLVGLDEPDDGRLTVGGRDVSEAGHRLRESVGFLPDRVGFPPALTGREVLSFHARIRGLEPDGRIPAVVETVGLSSADADRPVEGYSNGMRRRLGLASALLAEPSVLVLDEPTAGLDPRGVAEFHNIIDRIRAETDATVVIASHVLSEVERLCDKVAVIDDGRIRAAGPIAELVQRTETVVGLRPKNPDAVESVVAAARSVGQVTRDDGTVTVRCESGALPSLFASLDGTVEVGEVTVEQNGLEAVFHDALEEVPS